MASNKTTEWNFASGKSIADFTTLSGRMIELGFAIHDLTVVGSRRSVTTEEVAKKMGIGASVVVILLGKAKSKGLVNRISIQKTQQAGPRQQTKSQPHPPPPNNPPPPPQQPHIPPPAPLKTRVRAYDQVPIVMVEIEKLIRQLFRDKLATESADLDRMKQRYLKLKERVTHVDSEGNRSAESPEEWTASWMALDFLFKILKDIRSQS